MFGVKFCIRYFSLLYSNSFIERYLRLCAVRGANTSCWAGVNVVAGAVGAIADVLPTAPKNGQVIGSRYPNNKLITWKIIDIIQCAIC